MNKKKNFRYFNLLCLWLLFGLFGLACWQVLRQISQPTPVASNALPAEGLTLLVILGFAALFRMTVVGAPSSLSTDQFRYIWEGRLVSAGLSPYQYAPNDPAIVAYRSEVWPLVQQRETSSPYPPLAQLIGAVQYQLFGENLLGPKFVAIFFDGLVCLTLVWLLVIYRLDRRRLILYAWCPLPVIEFGISGHNDAPMLLFLLLAIGLAARHRPALSAAVLGLACLAKFTPLFGLPLFVIVWQHSCSRSISSPRWRWWSALHPAAWGYPALTLGVIMAGYIPLVILGNGAIGSLLEYTSSWHANDALFFQQVDLYFGLQAAKALSLFIIALAVSLLSLHGRLALNLSLPRRLILVLGIILLVASTVHPWYVTWVLVLLPLVYQEDEFSLVDKAWLLFAGLVQLVYLTYNGDEKPFSWIKPLEYWPVYLLVSYNIIRVWLRKGPAYSKSEPEQPPEAEDRTLTAALKQ